MKNTKTNVNSYFEKLFLFRFDITNLSREEWPRRKSWYKYGKFL